MPSLPMQSLGAQRSEEAGRQPIRESHGQPNSANLRMRASTRDRLVSEAAKRQHLVVPIGLASIDSYALPVKALENGALRNRATSGAGFRKLQKCLFHEFKASDLASNIGDLRLSLRPYPCTCCCWRHSQR